PCRLSARNRNRAWLDTITSVPFSVNGMSMLAVSCAIARSPASVTKIGPSRWLALTFRSAISFDRRTNSGPLALIQLIRTTESSNSLWQAHDVPQPAEPRAAINLGLGALHIYHVCFWPIADVPSCTAHVHDDCGAKCPLLTQSGHGCEVTPARAQC